MLKRIRPGRYQHYKGKFYEVVGIAYHSETLEELVLYKALYKARFGVTSYWVRPRRMFAGKVKIKGKKVPRFKLLKTKVKGVNRAQIKMNGKENDQK